MPKKRTSLDSVLPSPKAKADREVPSSREQSPPRVTKNQTLYLKLPVHRQLRALAFEEDAKMHELVLEGLDLLFAKRGLPAISDLLDQNK